MAKRRPLLEVTTNSSSTVPTKKQRHEKTMEDQRTKKEEKSKAKAKAKANSAEAVTKKNTRYVSRIDRRKRVKQEAAKTKEEEAQKLEETTPTTINKVQVASVATTEVIADVIKTSKIVTGMEKTKPENITKTTNNNEGFNMDKLNIAAAAPKLGEVPIPVVVNPVQPLLQQGQQPQGQQGQPPQGQPQQPQGQPQQGQQQQGQPQQGPLTKYNTKKQKYNAQTQILNAKIQTLVNQKKAENDEIAKSQGQPNKFGWFGLGKMFKSKKTKTNKAIESAMRNRELLGQRTGRKLIELRKKELVEENKAKKQPSPEAETLASVVKIMETSKNGNGVPKPEIPFMSIRNQIKDMKPTNTTNTANLTKLSNSGTKKNNSTPTTKLSLGTTANIAARKNRTEEYQKQLGRKSNQQVEKNANIEKNKAEKQADKAAQEVSPLFAKYIENRGAKANKSENVVPKNPNVEYLDIANKKPIEKNSDYMDLKPTSPKKAPKTRANPTSRRSQKKQLRRQEKQNLNKHIKNLGLNSNAKSLQFKIAQTSYKPYSNNSTEVKLRNLETAKQEIINSRTKLQQLINNNLDNQDKITKKKLFLNTILSKSLSIKNKQISRLEKREKQKQQEIKPAPKPAPNAPQPAPQHAPTNVLPKPTISSTNQKNKKLTFKNNMITLSSIKNSKELKKKYLKMALLYHPDKNISEGSREGSTERFKELVKLYENRKTALNTQ